MVRARLRRLRSSASLRHVLTLSSSNLIAQALTIAGIPLLSRIYGPASFGLLAIYVSVSTTVSLAATGRYEYAIPLPHQRRNALALAKSARVFLWVTSAVFEVLILVFLEDFARVLGGFEHRYWLLTIPLYIILLGESSILTLWHTRLQGFTHLGRFRIIFSLSTVLLQAAIGLLIVADVRGLIAGTLSAQAIGLGYLVLKSRVPLREWAGIRSRRMRVGIRNYRKMPLLNAPTALLDGLRNVGINLVIGAQSAAALGQYSMAWRTVQAPLGLLGSAFNQVYFQRMSRADRGNLYSVVRSTALKVALFTFPLFVVLFVICPWLLPAILGESWHFAGSFAQALVPWLFMNLVTSPIVSVFVVTGTQGRQAIFAIVYTLAPIALLFALREDPLVGVWATSIMMSLLLVGLTFMALSAAKTDDERQVESS